MAELLPITIAPGLKTVREALLLTKIVPEFTTRLFKVRSPHTINVPPFRVVEASVPVPENVYISPGFILAPLLRSMLPTGEHPGKEAGKGHCEKSIPGIKKNIPAMSAYTSIGLGLIIVKERFIFLSVDITINIYFNVFFCL